MLGLEAKLRALISEAASEQTIIGPLEESVKWGEASFTPVRKNVGSSVRIQPRKNGDVALMFICTTGLVKRFQETYPNVFQIEGDRALVFSAAGDIPEVELKHAIAMALT
ncbi:MAG: DUF1801 domain-containing protein, partial [Notoacmeibacter sp.]